MEKIKTALIAAGHDDLADRLGLVLGSSTDHRAIKRSFDEILYAAAQIKKLVERDTAANETVSPLLRKLDDIVEKIYGTLVEEGILGR